MNLIPVKLAEITYQGRKESQREAQRVSHCCDDEFKPADDSWTTVIGPTSRKVTQLKV